jgi:hypothetical protein
MEKIELIQPTESNRYSLFSEELESNREVLFHATLKENLSSIKKNGFLSADKLGKGILESVSYAFRSSGCLAHLNGKFGREYVVFAVKFKTLEIPEITVNISDIHVYKGVQPTEILGYCELPADFRYS